GNALEVLARLLRSHAGDVAVVAECVGAARARVELAGLAGDALRDDAGVLVDEDAHFFFPRLAPLDLAFFLTGFRVFAFVTAFFFLTAATFFFLTAAAFFFLTATAFFFAGFAVFFAGFAFFFAGFVFFRAATTFCAASAMLSAEMIGRPDSRRICFPRSSLVPFMRTTSGTESFTSRAAATTPAAMVSHFMMPPKMLTRIAFTFGFESMILNAAVTFSVVAPPPTSRKFAGEPPKSLIVSMVAMARPAPFTMQPISPSSEM